jgi:hypothetical protein
MIAQPIASCLESLAALKNMDGKRTPTREHCGGNEDGEGHDQEH